MERKTAESREPATKPSTAAAKTEKLPYFETREDCTDTGNAFQLATYAKDAARYVPALGKWLVWNRTIWELDNGAGMFDLAHQVGRNLFDVAKLAPAGSDDQKAIANHAAASMSAPRIDAMIRLASRLRELIIEHEKLDGHPLLLACSNGVVNLQTGELCAPDRSLYLTRKIPHAYNQKLSTAEGIGCACPRWMAFLREALPDADVRAFVQKAVGYSISGDTSEQVLFLNVGNGANGKSVFSETLLALFGELGIRTPSATLLRRHEGNIPNDLAKLPGRRLAVASETQDGHTLDEATVKALTGCDTIAARHMRAEWFEFKPVAKFWLATNSKPRVKDSSHGFWRRVRLVPWTVRFGKDGALPADPHLLDKLRQELPGIFKWCVDGALQWQATGLEPPAAVAEATRTYRDEEDSIRQFIDEMCDVGDGYSVTSGHLYKTFSDWCRENHEETASQRTFGLKLSALGFEATVSRTDGKPSRKRHGLKVNIQNDG